MRYGWLPQLNDQRDYRLVLAPPLVLPNSVNLRPNCPAVYDQGQLGSCTANAIAGLMEYDRIRQRLADFLPSRLFIYYNERVMENTAASDAGAFLRDGLKSVATLGACDEAEWPYNIGAFATQPPDRCFVSAKLDRALTYYYVAQTLLSLQTCLAAGFPFTFGFTVYQSFESEAVARTGVVPMPARRERPIGGHAVVCVGYNNTQQRFYLRNSWGPGWGQGGYFTMPYNYVLSPNLSADFWTIRSVG